MLFTRSDWLFKLVIASGIHLSALLWISRSRFPLFLRKKNMNYLVLQLSTGLVYTETIIDLSVGEEWQIFISTTIHPYFSEYTRLLKQQQQPITFFLFSNFISHLFSLLS